MASSVSLTRKINEIPAPQMYRVRQVSEEDFTGNWTCQDSGLGDGDASLFSAYEHLHGVLAFAQLVGVFVGVR
jgi:hypothetical protein